MTEMNRRGFLQGVFGGVTAAGVIVAASPAEVEAFASPLARQTPLVVEHPSVQFAHLGEFLYNARGECVAAITRLDIVRESFDATAFGDNNKVLVPGLQHIEICARGIGGLVLDARTFNAPRRSVCRDD
jgi:hypothetical protein